MRQDRHSFPLLTDRESARRLRSAICLNEEDRLWHRNTGGVVVYAVDNDVIKLYSDTRNMALGKGGDGDGDLGYTKMFSGDEDAQVIGIGRILAHFLFFDRDRSSTQRLPLFWVPPLDAEFANILGGVFRNAGGKLDNALRSAAPVDELIGDISKSDTDVASILIERAPEVVSILLGGESKHTELLRLCELVNEGRVLPLDEVDSISECLPEGFGAATKLKLSLLDLIWLSELREEWINRLTRPDDDESRKKAIETDADALSRLQLLNKRLEGVNIRLLMITGSHRVMAAAQGMPGMSEGRSFADSWLRHPRGFLGEPDIFLGNGDLGETVEPNRLPGMLDAFLAGTEGAEMSGKESSIELAPLYREAMSKLQAEWNQLSAGLCLTHPEVLQSPAHDPDAVAALIAKIRSADSSIKQFLIKAWHEAFLAAMQTGFLFSWSLRRDVRRNVPQLVFESFADASEFISDLLDQMQHSPGTEIEHFRSRIGRISRDGSKGYTTYLVFGVLFAAQDLWHIASSLAESALQRIFSDDRGYLMHVNEDQSRLITGREAFYLKAVAGRHLARSVRDLGAALDSTVLAEQVLELEREHRGDELLEGDHRFRYERCSINVAAAMFEKFLHEPGFGSKGMSIREMRDELDAILRSAPEECEEYTCAGGCHLESRVLTSLFIVELVLVAKLGDLFPERLRIGLDRFRTLFSGAHIGNPTKLAKAVFAVADCWGEVDAKVSQSKKTAAFAAIDAAESSVRPGECMPYEAERYRYLRNFVIGLRTSM